MSKLTTKSITKGSGSRTMDKAPLKGLNESSNDMSTCPNCKLPQYTHIIVMSLPT
jgi:hypothetical protein